MMTVLVGVVMILASSGVSGWYDVDGRGRGHTYRGSVCGVVVAVVSMIGVDMVVRPGVIVIEGLVVVIVALVMVGVALLGLGVVVIVVALVMVVID